MLPIYSISIYSTITSLQSRVCITVSHATSISKWQIEFSYLIAQNFGIFDASHLDNQNFPSKSLCLPGPVEKKNCPSENFYPGIKIFSNRAKNFCPTLKILSAWPGHV